MDEARERGYDRGADLGVTVVSLQRENERLRALLGECLPALQLAQDKDLYANSMQLANGRKRWQELWNRIDTALHPAPAAPAECPTCPMCGATDRACKYSMTSRCGSKPVVTTYAPVPIIGETPCPDPFHTLPPQDIDMESSGGPLAFKPDLSHVELQPGDSASHDAPASDTCPTCNSAAKRVRGTHHNCMDPWHDAFHAAPAPAVCKTCCGFRYLPAPPSKPRVPCPDCKPAPAGCVLCRGSKWIVADGIPCPGCADCADCADEGGA